MFPTQTTTRPFVEIEESCELLSDEDGLPGSGPVLSPERALHLVVPGTPRLRDVAFERSPVDCEERFGFGVRGGAEGVIGGHVCHELGLNGTLLVMNLHGPRLLAPLPTSGAA